MTKKILKYTIELTKEEREILEKASKIISELDDFALENNIEIFYYCANINDYLEALDGILDKEKIEANSTFFDFYF